MPENRVRWFVLVAGKEVNEESDGYKAGQLRIEIFLADDPLVLSFFVLDITISPLEKENQQDYCSP